MKFNSRLSSTVLLGLIFFGGAAFAKVQVKLIKPDVLMEKTGNYSVKSSPYYAQLEHSGMGGFLEMTIVEKGTDKVVIEKIKDVTGATWVANNRIVFTASPIYGKPGLYLLALEHGKSELLEAPKNKNRFYPDGADYFELVNTDSKNKTVQYYYTPDVDKTDFKKFRSKTNLRTRVGLLIGAEY